MAATGTPTPNIGLRIPLGTDPASVDDINYNSNLIDTKLGAVGDDSVQDQIDELNSKLVPESATVTGSYLYIKKLCGLIYILSNGAWTDQIIPTSYRPTAGTFMSPCVLLLESTVWEVGFISISTAGAVTFFRKDGSVVSASSVTQAYFNGVYW